MDIKNSQLITLGGSNVKIYLGEELPDMNEILFHTEPYPESLMLKKVQEYPHTPVLPRKIKTSTSRIVSGNFVKKIYFGRKAVKSVYINGECIFSKMELD